MVKFDRLRIKGLRGVKGEVWLQMNQKSVLLYGENGSGKSSFTDALEWFYFDKVGHLSMEEIGRKGVEALRNIFLNNNDPAFIELEFNDAILNSQKSITANNGSFTVESSNISPGFVDYLDKSAKENFILRYCDLMNFVLASKTERLKELSNIIGYSAVSNVRDILKSSTNALNREFKYKNYDGQISIQQGHIINCLGHNITSDKQYLSAIDDLIKPLKIGEGIKCFDDIGIVLAGIKMPIDQEMIDDNSFYTDVSDSLLLLSGKASLINESYTKYRSKFNQLMGNAETLSSICLNDLLEQGLALLERNLIKENICPLCLQSKDKRQLLEEMQDRLKQLKQVKKDQLELDSLKKELQKLVNESLQEIEAISKKERIKKDENKVLRLAIEGLLEFTKAYLSESNRGLLQGTCLKDGFELASEKPDLISATGFCEQMKAELKSKIHSDKTNIAINIETSRKAYLEINKLNKEKAQLEAQIASMVLILSKFIKTQKDSIEAFLTNISQSVNDSYKFMNSDEGIEDIQLVPIEKEQEMKGITISHSYYSRKVTPPSKYLSESHLNCLGISFFLASVKAFNKTNKVIILDDIISSFDSNHRKRFAELLIERFSDFQIVILTHEANWFEIMRHLVKGKNWIVKAIKWNDDCGTHLEEPPDDLRNIIEAKIESKCIDGLGNDIRKYLEQILKQIAVNLEVRMKFLLNETNEDRMAHELITELKSKINKHADEELKGSHIFDRLLNAVFISNKDSHNGSFTPGISDFKTSWQDIDAMVALFCCDECGKFISYKYYDAVNKLIRCGCGALSYNWK